jgi:hypothetical protein
MSSPRAWSTSSSCATEAGPRSRLAGTGILAALLWALAAAEATAASHKPGTGQLLTLVSDETGTRSVEVFDFRFVFFDTRYRQTHAPRTESPTGERIEVIEKRKECACLRLDDYAKVKFGRVREITITYPEGLHAALVRVTRMDGKVNEYPVKGLYGGTGLMPPRFFATVDGQGREFPLMLQDVAQADWPSERLVRVALFRPRPATPPPRPTR